MLSTISALSGTSAVQCTPLSGQTNSCVSLPSSLSTVAIVLGVFAVVVFIFTLICEIKIITKAGYSGWLVLTAFVPFVNVVMFIVFAFAKWPIQERLEAAERGGIRNFAPPQFVPSQHGALPTHVTTQPAQYVPQASPEVRTTDKKVVFCSWCGKERAVDAQSIHHCGSMERPAVYCMNCGTPFDAGASTCASCGTPSSQLSR
jgi:hypothetical protein